MEMTGAAPAGASSVQPSPNTNSDPPSGGGASDGGGGAIVGSDAPDYTARTDAEHDEEERLKKISNVKFVNATGFALTAVMVGGIVLFGAREEGVFGDDFLWMKYQTLVTPATYVDLIWIPIFILQGLFVYASVVHKTLQDSPLVGYDAATSEPRESIAVNYPAICATTLMTIYAHDYGHMFLAFLASLLCAVIVGNVLRVQAGVLDEVGSGAGGGDDVGDDFVAVDNVTSRALRYLSLRLPFELFGGYVLSLVALYLNAFACRIEFLPTMAHLVLANLSLAALTGAGFYTLWKIPERKLYGFSVALVWYLLGVYVELRAPTQPIYNEFSDGAILATHIVAGAAVTLLLTMLGVRVMKTMIKQNIFNCGGALGGRTVASEEDEISTDYVHA